MVIQKINKVVLLLLFTQVFVFSVFSQNELIEITGIVKNTDNETVPFSIIKLCNIKDSSVKEYHYADKNGQFVISIPNTFSYLLLINSLGYKSKYHFLSTADSVKSFNLKIILEKDYLTLNEVVIEAIPKIKVNGDTVAYKLAAFTEGNERSLEEALSRLPGFSISETGRISVNGQPIQKILIEGENLVDKNYTMLSKNISPDYIYQVEVLNKYQDNPLLKNIEKSEDVALNLRFKKEFKKAVFGNGRIEGGFNSRYNVLGNGFLLSKYFKTYATLTANNIGDEISSISTKELKTTAQISKTYEPTLDFKNTISNNPITLPFIDQNRVSENSFRLGSLNTIISVTPKLSIKSNINFFGNQKKMATDIIQKFLVKEDTIVMNESSRWTGKPLVFDGRLNINYNLSKTRINYTWDKNCSKNTDSRIISLNSSDVNISLSTRNEFDRHTLNIVSELGVGKVLNLELINYKNSIYQNMNGDGFSFGSLIKDSSIKQLVQLLSSPLVYSGGNLRFYHKIGISTLIYSIQYDSYKTFLNTSATIGDSLFSQNAVKTYYGSLLPRFEFNTTFFNKIELTTRAGLNFANLNNHTATFFEPEINLIYNNNYKNKFSIGSKSGGDFPDFLNLYNNYIFNDYRTLVNFAYSTGTIRKNTYSFSYRYNDVFNQFLVNGSIFYSQQNNNFQRNSIVNNYFTITQRVFSDRTTSLWGINFGISKYLRSLSGTIKSNCNYLQTTSFNSVNEPVARVVKSESLSATVNYSSAYKGPVNLIFTSGLSFINNKLYKENDVSASSSKISKTVLKINYKLLHNYYFELLSSRYQWILNNKTLKASCIADFLFTANIPSKQFTYYFKIQNLFNVKTINFSNSSVFSFSDNYYGILPRMVLVGFSIKM